MNRYFYLLVIFAGLLTGCEEAPSARAMWQTAPETHECASEQMIKVQSESKWCSENTTYLSTYCYGAAILRNCVAKVAK